MAEGAGEKKTEIIICSTCSIHVQQMKYTEASGDCQTDRYLRSVVDAKEDREPDVKHSILKYFLAKVKWLMTGMLCDCKMPSEKSTK